MNRTKPIDGKLLELKEEILGYALEYNLDFYDVIFEVCDYDTINILAAQGGFPNRYPHWRFGMEYDQLYKGYAYGLQKIYEMVVNTKPCYAYLLNVNNFIDHKIVMAHVYGHADFFKNNCWFGDSDRDMMNVMANHGTKIRRYFDKYGQNKVEDFIDKVLSLENLLDVDVIFQRKDIKNRRLSTDNIEDVDGRSVALKSFMNSKLSKEKREEKQSENGPTGMKKIGPKVKLNTVTKNRKDIMKFLINHAPLSEWQADILGILREEAYYFLPQRMTKIMNEGWASYWHSTIMTQKALRASEIINFADHHAGVMAMSKKQINPYKIGLELFRDIEYRWDTGKFGKDYNDCTDLVEKEQWDKKLGQGRDKIFEVRKSHNDITFIDEFFTEDFCNRQKIFTYSFNPTTGRNEIKTRDFQEIKARLLSQLTNSGQPIIEVESGNYGNRGELLLKHIYNSDDLDANYTGETLKNIFYIWQRPVHLMTIVEGKEIIFSFDGQELKKS